MVFTFIFDVMEATGLMVKFMEMVTYSKYLGLSYYNIERKFERRYYHVPTKTKLVSYER